MIPRLDTFRNVTRIVTHPGNAHRDDFLATCLVLGAVHYTNDNTWFPVIQRREPDAYDLNNPAVAVLDVGRRHEPELLNFDHHQLGSLQVCSISLVLQAMDLYETALDAWPWLDLSEVMDVLGPVKAAAHLRVSSEIWGQTRSPVEHIILKKFGAVDEITGGASFGVEMAMIGRMLVAELLTFTDRYKVIQEAPRWKFDRTNVLDLRCLDPEDDAFVGLNAWVKNTGEKIGAVVLQDNRGPGWTLYRWNDCLDVDFSRIAPLVTYASATGHIAKTRDREDPTPLLELACQ